MPRDQRPTKPGKLSDSARHVVAPSGIVSTGWPAVRDTCAGFGVLFDPWQDGTGRLILAKRADGLYAASVGGVVISIPRQVGKTFLIGSLMFALCLLSPGLTVIWTAHRLRTASETFAAMQAFARRRRVRPHVAKIVLGSGDEAIEFANESRILFGARERGFGRGFSDVGALVFDEAQILTENAIDDMVPAMNQAVNPLLIFTGTPPKPTDPSEVFARKRRDALSGDSDDTVYIEFSADEGCDPGDRKQWAKANASYPRRTPDPAMMRMRKNLSPESFMREGLGVWDPDDAGAVISERHWAALTDGHSLPLESTVKLALDAPPDRMSATFSTAGIREDGLLHVQVRFHCRPTQKGDEPLKNRVIAMAQALSDGHKTALILPPNSPAKAWKADLVKARVELDEMTAAEYVEACGRVLNAVDDGALRHRGQPELTTAVKGLAARKTGDVEAWSRRSSTTNIAPFVAATCALARVPVDVPVEVWAFRG